RGRMWADALAAHRAGDVRAVEVRGSDYLGPGIGAHGHVSRQLNGMARGKRPWGIGSADQAQPWADVGDMGAATVASDADGGGSGFRGAARSRYSVECACRISVVFSDGARAASIGIPMDAPVHHG